MGHIRAFEKHPEESYPVQIDFTGELPAGSSIASATATAVDEAGVDASSEVVGTLDVSGNLVTYNPRAGTAGKFYDFTIRIALTGGTGPLIERRRMIVTENPG